MMSDAAYSEPSEAVILIPGGLGEKEGSFVRRAVRYAKLPGSAAFVEEPIE